MIATLNDDEVLGVSGGDKVVSGLACAGGIIGLAATDGTLAVLGVGLGTAAACLDFVQQITPVRKVGTGRSDAGDDKAKMK